MIQEIKNECGDRLGINSLLMLPIQHLPRYGILLAEMTKELLKSIDVMKNEVAAFCVAEKNVQRMLTIVNESMSISDIKNSLVSNGTKLNIYYHTIISISVSDQRQRSRTVHEDERVWHFRLGLAQKISRKSFPIWKVHHLHRECWLKTNAVSRNFQHEGDEDWLRARKKSIQVDEGGKAVDWNQVHFRHWDDTAMESIDISFIGEWGSNS